MAGAVQEVGLEQLPAWAEAQAKELAAAIDLKTIRVCLQLVKADVKENFQGSHTPDGTPWKPLLFPRPRSKGADKPLLDRGLLQASISASGKGHVEEVTPTGFTVGTNLEYASLHQYGGVIRPRKGQFLAIPKSKEAARAGSARNFKEPLTAIIGKRGGVLVQRTKKGNKVHYALVRQVTVPARPFAGFSEKVLQQIDEVLAKKMAGER